MDKSISDSDKNKNDKNKNDKIPPIKKKRGRKPKPKPLNPEKKIPKKRGRKPKDSYIVSNNNINLDANKEFVENIIIHLPIKNKLIQINDNSRIKNVSNIKYEINDIENGLMTGLDNGLTTVLDNEKHPDPFDPYENINMNIEVTNHVCNICWWDDHEFKNNRWGIPLKFINNNFHIYGCFCSPNCAAAYLFNMYKDSDDIWNKYSLLNFMYNTIYKTNISIKCASSKLILKKYGGTLTIKEFREQFNKRSNNYYINIPSTIINNVNIENINTDNSHESDNHELRLFRRGPVLDYKQTLENSMNLNIC
jgi:hypothetical protein